jgi:hypothetical protein
MYFPQSQRHLRSVVLLRRSCGAGVGLSLFEVNPTFTAFDKVSHDKTTGIINKQPCN